MRELDPKEVIIDDFVTAAWQNDIDIIDDMAAKHPWLVDKKNPYLAQALYAAANSAQKDSARVLVEKYGADVNARLDGATFLHQALNSADMVTARMLIANGADINAKDESRNGFTDGWTPLHYAVSHQSEDMVRLLARKYVDASIKNAAGQTAAQMAREEGHTVFADFVDEVTAKNAPRPQILPMPPKKRPGGSRPLP